MPLINLRRARLAFGHHPLLEEADFQVDARERVGLIGRNGTGKSSLLRVLAGETTLDSGDFQIATGARVAYVPQEPALDPDDTVFDAVALGAGDEGRLLADYHAAILRLDADPESAIALET